MTSILYLNVIILTALCLTNTNAKVLRNEALISKMVSNFQQKDNALSHERQDLSGKPSRVLTLMQNVLCKNFPMIPCNMIIQDETLKELIKNSIKQIREKNSATERSDYDQRGTGIDDANADMYVNAKSHKNRKRAEWQKKKYNQRDKKKNRNKEAMLHYGELGGRKKLRKFYPHMIKIKERSRKIKPESKERQSISAEVPDLTNHHKTYESDNPPVWHRDYTKHGEPSINVFTYDNDRDKQLRTKIIKNAADDADYERYMKKRKDVLHPDVYIKKRLKNKPVDLSPNSDGME